MNRNLVTTITGPLVVAAAGWQMYRRRRRRQLLLMPKGINTAHGITMRSSIKAARPTAVAR